MFSVSETPKSIVHLRPDTIGDLIIFSSALRAWLELWPDARHTLVVRAGYESLAPLFPAGLEWVVADLNPFRQKPQETRPAFAALIADLAARDPDLIIASTLNRTWLESAVASRFPRARRVVLGSPTVDPLFATALRLEFKIDAATVFDDILLADPTARDWANNRALIHHVAGRPDVPVAAPAVTPTPAALVSAADVLTQHDLPHQGWAAVFAAGFANVSIKAWPAASFAALVNTLRTAHHLPVMLLGHANEEDSLVVVADAVAATGAPRPPIWLGRDGELPLLAALLSTARLYVGHDTGAMHLAAAVGRPTVGIFGGGHWPRFRPVGHQVAAVVQPLPCFNCNWDCHFGDAPCVKTLAPADVARAVAALLAAGDAPLDLVVESHALPALALALIAAATPRYRALQQDRLDRQSKIEELKSDADDKATEIAGLKTAAEERKTEMESIKAELEAECATKDAEIADLKHESDTKDTEIADLKRETDGKDAEIADLKSEADTKDAEIAQLKRETDGKDAEIDAIKATANEREALIITLDGHIKNFQAIVAEKDCHIANLDDARARENAAAAEKLATTTTARAAAEAARDELQTILDRLPENPAHWAQLFHDKDVHIRNLDALIYRLRTTLAERDASLANHAAGYHTLETAKHYGQLLSDKEAVIQSLAKACQEREATIRALAGEAAGFGPRAAKLNRALNDWWRAKIALPFGAWLERKILTDYWMQIGILRHYEPRPLVWDQRMLKKSRLPAAQLPAIGVVTPSYGQAAFIESTMLSVLNQAYPKLRYVVQDGGSRDATPEIVARYADRLVHWESAPDAGQADAVRKGFLHLEDQLGPTDVMAWLNSDDLLAPRTLAHVADYFARHPEVDVIYGHRIIIDFEDRDVGRWVMPPHERDSLAWIDYVPQETMFWRKRAWDKVGGIDPSFQFALDWELLARFTQADCNIVRLPYYLGCFRVHPAQKTSAVIHTTGAEEMVRIRRRFHGEKQDSHETIMAWANRIRFRGALTSRLQDLGIRL